MADDDEDDVEKEQVDASGPNDQSEQKSKTNKRLHGAGWTGATPREGTTGIGFGDEKAMSRQKEESMTEEEEYQTSVRSDFRGRPYLDDALTKVGQAFVLFDVSWKADESKQQFGKQFTDDKATVKKLIKAIADGLEGKGLYRLARYAKEHGDEVAAAPLAIKDDIKPVSLTEALKGVRKAMFELDHALSKNHRSAMNQILKDQHRLEASELEPLDHDTRIVAMKALIWRMRHAWGEEVFDSFLEEVAKKKQFTTAFEKDVKKSTGASPGAGK